MNIATSVRLRIEASRRWEQEFAKYRNSSCLVKARDELSRQIYSPPFEPDLLMAAVESELTVNGFSLQAGFFDESECAALIQLFNQGYPHRLGDRMAISTELLDFLRSHRIFERIIEALHGQTGLMHLVWHSVPVFKQATTVQPSDAWHYDNHYSSYTLKLMVYLNGQAEAKGATDFCSSKASSAFTAATNYIGVLPQRDQFKQLARQAQDILNLDNDTLDPPYLRVCPEDPGTAIWFYPHPVLHRGIAPSNGERHVLSFSMMALPKGSPISVDDCASTSYQILADSLANAASQSDLAARISYLTVDSIPYFLPEQEAESVETAPVLSPLLVSHTEFSADYINEIIAEALSLSGSSSGLLGRISAHVFAANRSEAFVDIQTLVHAITAAITSICSPQPALQQELLRTLGAYVSSLNNEIVRYRLPKDRIFWPNPVHESYPSKLSDADLAVRRHALFDSTTPIGSAGSCFAFEIAEVLQVRGFNYRYYEDRSKKNRGLIILPQQDEAAARTGNPDIVNFSADYGIIFNSLSLYQLAERAFTSPLSIDRVVCQESGYVMDPFRENVLFPNLSAYVEEYALHSKALADAFSDVQVFLFTLGLNECWRLRQSGRAISRNPRHNALMPLLRHSTLSVQDNVDAIQGFFDLVKAHNQSFKLILTVSPIPFLATGRGETHHVVEANHHSKSVLTVAANQLAAANADIYYFPSYEQTMYIMQDHWHADGRHLKPAAVEQNVDLFLKMFAR